MTISLERIRARLSPRFPSLEQIEENVLRFERQSHDRPFAVCYVDVSAQIPNTAALLSDYQERILATRYFKGRKSLQWSNYLYFVVDVDPKPEARAVVERDRRYARKFVLTEPELDTALTPPTYKVSDAAIKTDILTTWTNILSETNLDHAILNDESLPRRLELIEEHFGKSASPIPRSFGTPRASKQPSLRRIVLDKFRLFPQLREYDLGTVTLVCGANGSGKTSLLEAIELVYCGHTKRNPKAPGSYSIVATYGDGTTDIANHRRPPSLFRDRNLAWYGQHEQRTANLYQTFGRFNFLNTDAAVGLAESKSEAELEEDLSKLMVGPEASKTWKEIERTAEKLDGKIKELLTLRNQVDQELASVERQIAGSEELKQESGAILKKLDSLLSEISWTRAEGDSSSSVKDLVESLSVYGTIVKEAIKCDWAGAPVTLAGLKQFVKDGSVRAKTSGEAIMQYSDALASERRLAQELSQIERDVSTLTELFSYTEAGLPQRLAEFDALAPTLTRYQQHLAGFDKDAMQPHLVAAMELTVSAFAKATSAQVDAAKHQLGEAQQGYSKFSALREESANLAQRLREVASQILKSASDPDTCPLCHTAFFKGELTKHIHSTLDPLVEARAMLLLEAVRGQESIVAGAQSAHRTASWALTFCKRIGEPTSIGLSRLMQLVSDSENERAGLTQKQSQLGEEIALLQKAGMTAEKYRQLIGAGSAAGASTKAEDLKQRRDAAERLRTEKTTELEGYKTKGQSLLNAVADALATKNATFGAIESALSELKERIVTTEGILDRLNPLISRFAWSPVRPLSELALSIETVRRTSGDYQATLSKEQSAVTVLAEATQRKDQIERQLAGLTPRIERFSEARDVLTKIQSEHSLPGAMEDALKQNRVAIEAIFSRIHSPAEFSGLGDKLTTLVRKGEGSIATLHQISTGQRAAFALSLFLAQNAQLRSAPPLILIDDPIAHVDDLNCLSFLDYLREVVITGDRQVVFATANDKLAALFERKFDFLGDNEFKRYNLTR
jgi:DNA repair protein SbcC/Rad50